MIFESNDVGKYFWARGGLWMCIGLTSDGAILDRLSLKPATGQPAEVRLVPGNDSGLSEEFVRANYPEEWK